MSLAGAVRFPTRPIVNWPTAALGSARATNIHTDGGVGRRRQRRPAPFIVLFLFFSFSHRPALIPLVSRVLFLSGDFLSAGAGNGKTSSAATLEQYDRAAPLNGRAPYARCATLLIVQTAHCAPVNLQCRVDPVFNAFLIRNTLRLASFSFIPVGVITMFDHRNSALSTVVNYSVRAPEIARDTKTLLSIENNGFWFRAGWAEADHQGGDRRSRSTPFFFQYQRQKMIDYCTVESCAAAPPVSIGLITTARIKSHISLQQIFFFPALFESGLALKRVDTTETSGRYLHIKTLLFLVF